MSDKHSADLIIYKNALKLTYNNEVLFTKLEKFHYLIQDYY